MFKIIVQYLFSLSKSDQVEYYEHLSRFMRLYVNFGSGDYKIYNHRDLNSFTCEYYSCVFDINGYDVCEIKPSYLSTQFI